MKICCTNYHPIDWQPCTWTLLTLPVSAKQQGSSRLWSGIRVSDIYRHDYMMSWKHIYMLYITMTILWLSYVDSYLIAVNVLSCVCHCFVPGLWALVNNAGVSLPVGPSDWLTIEDYKSLMAVNLFGVIDVTLSVLPLIKRVKGRVVNMASVHGRITPTGGPYCISKYGVESFNDGLRWEKMFLFHSERWHNCLLFLPYLILQWSCHMSAILALINLWY